MRIKNLHLEAFGPFTGTGLDFLESSPDLHLVYGANEAGKSSTLRGLIAWLYGFPERTTDNFLHSNDQLRIAGELEGSGGESLVFSRRKKRKGSVLDARGDPLDPGVIQVWLQGLDQDAFRALFGLDHAGLRSGGTTILQEKGSVGTTLFSAGTGSTSVQTLLKDLQEESRTLFLRQGSKPSLNAALRRFKDVKRDIGQASLSSREWKDQERALRRAEAELQDRRTRRKQVQVDLQGLQRLQQALKPLGILRQAQAELRQLGPVPALPDDFPERHRSNQEQLRQAEKSLAAASKRLEDARSRAEAIELNTELLDQSETIRDLHQRLGAFRKGQADRRDLQEHRLREEAAAEAILRRIRPDLDTGQAEALRNLLKQRREVLVHGKKMDVLDKECTDSNGTVRAKAGELKAARDGLDALPLERDLTSLNRALDAAAGLGDIDRTIDEQTAETAREEQAFASGLSRLGHWQGRPDQLLHLPLPLEATIRGLKRDWENLELEGRDLHKTRSELSKRIGELERDIAAQELAGDVPSEEELEARRDRREKGWILIRRNWLNQEDVGAEAREYHPEQPLSDAYAAAVQAADLSADRLRRESSRVHAYARLQAELRQANRQWTETEEAESGLAARWKELQAGWQQVWQPAGIKPDNPEVMSEWLGEIKEWRVKARQIVEGQAKAGELIRKRGEVRSLLETSLQDLDEAPPRGESLAPALKAAQKAQARFEEIRNKEQTLQETIRRLQGELDQARDRVNLAEETRSNWQAQWTAYLQELGLPATETPNAVSDFFEDLETCLRHLESAAGFKKRIQGIDRDAGELQQDVAILAARAAPELVDLPVDQAVERFNGLLSRARTDETTLHAYQETIASTLEEIREAGIERDSAAEELNRLCRLAGCRDQSELEAVEQHWRRGVELEKTIAVQQEALREIAGALSLEELAAEVERTDTETLPWRLQECEESLQNLHEAIEAQNKTVGELETRFQAMDGRAEAARKAEEAEETLTEIHRLAERYTRLRLAARVLEEAIERFRAANQDPLLVLAGGYFQELTLGSFEGLRTDLDDSGEQVIVGLRPGGSRVPVQGMSDGTRDQLYLSLRLASLEYRLEKSEAIPFIVDDVLINFDEQRTKAALQALARLSEKNQVLLFSHHRLVAEMVSDLGIGQVHAL